MNDVFAKIQKKSRLTVPAAEFLQHQAGNGEAEDGCNVHHGAIDLRLAGAPFVIEQGCISGAFLRFGTHASFCAAGCILALVHQQFIAVHTLELAGRTAFHLLEPLWRLCDKECGLL